MFNYARANALCLEFTGSYDVGNWSAYDNFSIGRERATQVASQQFNFQSDDLAYIANHNVYTDHSRFPTGSAGTSYNLRGTRLTPTWSTAPVGARTPATCPIVAPPRRICN